MSIIEWLSEPIVDGVPKYAILRFWNETELAMEFVDTIQKVFSNFHYFVYLQFFLVLL